MFKKFFMDKSLKSRITFLYTLFAVAVVGVITFYAYSYMVGLLKVKETSILSDSIEYLEKSISTRISDINEEYINNFDNDRFLKLYLESVKGGRSLAEQIELNNQFRNYFLDIRMRNNDLVQSIQMVSGDGTVYSDESVPILGEAQFAESSYYSECMENKNKILYCNREQEAKHFSILRSFYFQYDGEGNSAYPGVGYISEKDEDYSTLIFFLKKSYLQKMIEEEAEKRQTNILILDQDGKVVVQAGDLDWLVGGDCSTLIKEVRGYSGGDYEKQLERERAGIHIRSIERMGWDIVYIYDMNILYRQAAQIRHVAFVIFVLAVFAVFLIASFISGTVVEPIQILAKSMDEAVENNMEVAFEPKYNDEIAGLGRKFRALMGRISALMGEIKRVEEQKRAEELKALQAQINPHFLYNTLDMVYWLAKMDNNNEIADLIADLADFFRLSLNKGEDITSVKREVEHVRKYLEIQKVRMDGKFDYEIHLTPEIQEERIPKLILQPFVENSLVHGFENIPYQGNICIDVSKEDEIIVFCITDNGTGIDRETLEKLNRGDDRENDRENDQESEDHGYAIGNVRDRVVLYAGNEYGVEFDTEQEQGTKVRIWFPSGFQREETKDD